MRRRQILSSNIGGDSIVKFKITKNRRKRRQGQLVGKSLGIFSLCLIGGLVIILQFYQVSPSSRKRKPRTVVMYDDMRSISTNSSTIHNTHNKESICEPIVAWQEITNTNCNIFHEMDLANEDAKLVNSGFIRAVWNIVDEKE